MLQIPRHARNSLNLTAYIISFTIKDLIDLDFYTRVQCACIESSNRFKALDKDDVVIK